MRNINFKKCLASFLLATICAFILTQNLNAQKMDGIERDRMKSMLKNIKNAIKDDYYDDKFHGIDLETRFKQAEARLKEVETTGQGLGVIAQVLMDFNDSHLFFLPPATNLQVEYGLKMKMIGDKCYVLSVQPKSDAAEKGLKAGDQLLSVEGFRPTKTEFWKMMYYYNLLSKRPQLNLSVLSPGSEQPKSLTIASKIKQMPNSVNYQNLFTLYDSFSESDNSKHLFRKMGGITIWRMPGFDFEPSDVDSIMSGKIGNSSSLILDLRGNGGGYVKTLERLAGYFFDKDLKIAEIKGRKKMEPIELKTKGKDVFAGKLIVLIDSESASASEIFARLVQLEKRGTVLGDVSSGSVMQSRSFTAQTGSGYYGVLYGASITNADVIMSDGKSLEHSGVIPDELMLPTASDVAAERDVVLSKAIELVGGKVTPEEAGKFFPYDWYGR